MLKYEAYNKNKDKLFILHKILREEQMRNHPIGYGWRLDLVEGETTTELSWKLNIKSRIQNRISKIWPLNGIVLDFYVEKNDQLFILFEEYLYNEKPLFPFNLDKESRWLAAFDFKKRYWNLTRVSFLEGMDKN